MGNFNKAFDFVIGNEGIFSNEENDRGGATKFGITQNELSLWRKKPVTLEEIQAMPLSEAKLIYRSNYWSIMSLDLVSDALAIILFDQGVNRGVRTVVKQLQQIISVKPDGVLGKRTIEHLDMKPERMVCFELIKMAQVSYVKIVKARPSNLVFLAGWINRTHKLLDLVTKG